MLRRTQFSRAINRVAVWGGGTMGGGIAQVTASAGIPVSVVEVTEDACNNSQKVIAKSLSRVAKKKAGEDAAAQKAFVDGIMSNITFTTNFEEAASTADLAIEAIVEKMEAKVDLWKKLDAVAPKECIFASNTSSLSITEQAAVTTRKDRFGGLHFFSPVPMMKLVEIIATDETSAEVTADMKAYIAKIGKTGVIARDTKGFIVNRLLIPYMLESARLVERGVASPEDVDVAMKLGAGHPMGPFTLIDSVGIDVTKLIADAWHKVEPENPLFVPSKLIDEKVAAGKLGRKSGEGFYKY